MVEATILEEERLEAEKARIRLENEKQIELSKLDQLLLQDSLKDHMIPDDLFPLMGLYLEALRTGMSIIPLSLPHPRKNHRSHIKTQQLEIASPHYLRVCVLTVLFRSAF